MVSRKRSLKEIFSKTLQNSQENTAPESLCDELHPPDRNFNKNEIVEHVFFCEFYEFFKNTRFVENLRKAASVTRFGSSELCKNRLRVN